MQANSCRTCSILSASGCPSRTRRYCKNCNAKDKTSKIPHLLLFPRITLQRQLKLRMKLQQSALVTLVCPRGRWCCAHWSRVRRSLSERAERTPHSVGSSEAQNLRTNQELVLTLGWCSRLMNVVLCGLLRCVRFVVGTIIIYIAYS